jgi:hypothetical protein
MRARSRRGVHHAKARSIRVELGSATCVNSRVPRNACQLTEFSWSKPTTLETGLRPKQKLSMKPFGGQCFGRVVDGVAFSEIAPNIECVQESHQVIRGLSAQLPQSPADRTAIVLLQFSETKIGLLQQER